jgi:hypothetical protein
MDISRRETRSAPGAPALQSARRLAMQGAGSIDARLNVFTEFVGLVFQALGLFAEALQLPEAHFLRRQHNTAVYGGRYVSVTEKQKLSDKKSSC